ncbi:glutathione S-transferase [Mycena sanguinolenta]|nr:glutathione S-transferase [Mycena sanguinolenta]
MKPIPPGPNPWKVVTVRCGDDPYFKFDNIKKPPFIHNPNGRVPAIEDPNTDIVLWESGAIINYILEQYDTKKTLSFDTVKEKHQVQQWLFFQCSGQGPYFGQAGWFNVLHPERIPSCMVRYNAEVHRILSVLEGWLSGESDVKNKGQSKQWLVGDKMTIADMSFVPWNDRTDATISCAPEDKFKGYPYVQAWHERMIALPSWKVAMEMRAAKMGEQGLMWNGMPKGMKSFEEYQAKIAAGEDTGPKEH